MLKNAQAVEDAQDIISRYPLEPSYSFEDSFEDQVISLKSTLCSKDIQVKISISKFADSFSFQLSNDGNQIEDISR